MLLTLILGEGSQGDLRLDGDVLTSQPRQPQSPHAWQSSHDTGS
jgi:hypothetical protein